MTELCPEGRPASVEDEILPPAPPPPPPPVHRTAAKRRKVVVEDSSGEDDGREGAGGRGTPTAGTKDVCKLEDWIGAELACDMAKLSHDYQMTKTATDKRISLGGLHSSPFYSLTLSWCVCTYIRVCVRASFMQVCITTRVRGLGSTKLFD